MRISSPVFSDGETIPQKYTCDGTNISPPLEFSDVPAETKSLALIVEDPDAPHGIFTHWVLWGMNADRRELRENDAPPEAVELQNGFGEAHYGGPKPPSGSHRYYFRLYALDALVEPPPNSQCFHQAIADHVLEEASVMGRYERKPRSSTNPAAA